MPAAGLDRVRVLLIDDMPEFRGMLLTMLRRLGVGRVLEASTGAEGLERLDAEEVDLVVCDWGLPDLSGVEVLRRVRGKAPSLPFLMLTGNADLTAVKQAKEAGVSGYLVKPVSPRDLEAKIRSLTKTAS